MLICAAMGGCLAKSNCVAEGSHHLRLAVAATGIAGHNKIHVQTAHQLRCCAILEHAIQQVPAQLPQLVAHMPAGHTCCKRCQSEWAEM